MDSPFQRSHHLSYAAVAPCMMATMSQFNRAAEEATQQADACECSICHDTLGPNLADVLLPGCKHRFHELCIQTWLSPIQLPDTTREPVIFFSGLVDNTFREIEDRCIVWETLARHSVHAFASAEPAGTLFSGNDIDSEVEARAEAAYDQDEEMSDGPEVRAREIASGLPTPSDGGSASPSAGEVEELEEGEIREGQRVNGVFTNPRDRMLQAGMVLPISQQPQRLSQDLPEISEHYMYDITPFPPREASHSCPYCRDSAFFENPIDCHADTLQLIRVRLRLTDLAYRCLGFLRSDREQQSRVTIIDFLNRRHADNITLGEREIPLTPSSCKRVFRQARSILRKDAYTYIVGHGLEHGSAEHSRVMRFGTFFEKFRLRNEDIPFFFDANPAFNEFVWGHGFRLMQYQQHLLQRLLEHRDPRFFRMLRLGLAISPHSYVPFPPPSPSDDEASSSDDEDGDLSMSDD